MRRKRSKTPRIYSDSMTLHKMRRLKGLALQHGHQLVFKDSMTHIEDEKTERGLSLRSRSSIRGRDSMTLQKMRRLKGLEDYFYCLRPHFTDSMTLQKMRRLKGLASLFSRSDHRDRFDDSREDEKTKSRLKRDRKSVLQDILIR